MVGCDSRRNLDYSTGLKVTCGRLEEEKGFLWYGIVQLLDVIDIVPANSDDLRILDFENALRRKKGLMHLFAVFHK